MPGREVPDDFRRIARLLGVPEEADEAACVAAIRANLVPIAEHEAALAELAAVEREIERVRSKQALDVLALRDLKQATIH